MTLPKCFLYFFLLYFSFINYENAREDILTVSQISISIKHKALSKNKNKFYLHFHSLYYSAMFFYFYAFLCYFFAHTKIYIYSNRMKKHHETCKYFKKAKQLKSKQNNFINKYFYWFHCGNFVFTSVTSSTLL